MNDRTSLVREIIFHNCDLKRLCNEFMATKPFSSTYLLAGIGGLETGIYHAVASQC